MKPEIGKKYRIKFFKKRPRHWNSNGEMDKWMGKIVTIKSYKIDNITIAEESYWAWQKSDFEEILLDFEIEEYFKI
jgi:hypothetical protein